MSSVAVATDAPEEFAALADDAVDDFMSEAASDVEVFATTEGHRDVCAEEILTRDAQAHDRVVSRVARLPRRVLRCLLGAAGFEAPVWQTRIRRATSASLAEEVAQWYRSGSAPMRIVEAALATHAAQVPALKSLWAAVLESEDLLPHVLGPRAIRVFETNLHIRASFTKWEPGMPVALVDQLHRPRLK